MEDDTLNLAACNPRAQNMPRFMESLHGKPGACNDRADKHDLIQSGHVADLPEGG